MPALHCSWEDADKDADAAGRRFEFANKHTHAQCGDRSRGQSWDKAYSMPVLQNNQPVAVCSGERLHSMSRYTMPEQKVPHSSHEAQIDGGTGSSQVA